MKIATAWSTEPSPKVVSKLYQKLLDTLGDAPDLLVLHASVEYEGKALIAALNACAPGIPIHGGTSCRGVMTEAGLHMDADRGLGLFGLSDPDGGTYGVGAAEFGDDPGEATRKALSEALDAANAPGEMPAMIWLSSAPGHEEIVLATIAQMVGDNVPIAGGSAADNTVSGEWLQFANDRVYKDGVAILAMFPSSDVHFAFHSGYEPTDRRGMVTHARGRELLEIDGRPAAEVYNEWTRGLIADYLAEEETILSQSTFNPLGRVVGEVEGLPYYQLSHPSATTREQSLQLFTCISAGEEIVLMRGTKESLVSRVGRVAMSALEAHGAHPRDVAGALIIYCAGCMLGVHDQLDRVVESLHSALPGVPFLGAFTFGEQGTFLGGENRHGNLMISVLLFSR